MLARWSTASLLLQETQPRNYWQYNVINHRLSMQKLFSFYIFQTILTGVKAMLAPHPWWVCEVRGARSVRCVGGRQSVDSWDLESPVTSLSVLLTHPALPPRHSYAPDTCNNSQQHLHTPHCTPHCREHCRVLQLLWKPSTSHT